MCTIRGQPIMHRLSGLPRERVKGETETQKKKKKTMVHIEVRDRETPTTILLSHHHQQDFYSPQHSFPFPHSL